MVDIVTKKAADLGEVADLESTDLMLIQRGDGPLQTMRAGAVVEAIEAAVFASFDVREAQAFAALAVEAAQRMDDIAAVPGSSQYAAAADALSMGVAAVTITGGGAGGTDGVYPWSTTGGGGTNAAGYLVVAGGAITSIVVEHRGEGYTSAPTIAHTIPGLGGETLTPILAQNELAGSRFVVAVVNGFESFVVDAGGATATSEGVYPSKSGLTFTEVATGKNLFVAAQVEVGIEVYGDGTISVQADSAVSGLIRVDGLSTITVAGLQANPAIVPIGRFLQVDRTTVDAVVAVAADDAATVLTVPSTSFWFQFSPKQRNADPADYSAVQVEAGSVRTAYEAPRDLSVIFVGERPLAPARGVGSRYTYVGRKNLFDPSEISAGVEVYGDGTISVQADSAVSGLMYVRGLSTITVAGLQANPAIVPIGRFLQEDRATVSDVVAVAAADAETQLVVPSDAWWFQFSPKQRNADPADYSAVQVEAGSVRTAYEAFLPEILAVNDIFLRGASSPQDGGAGDPGLSMLLFGDSISETSDVDVDDHAWDSTYRDNYPKYLLPELGITTGWNYAKSGAHFASAAGLSTNQKFLEQVAAAIIDGPAANTILVALGTNDIGSSSINGGSQLLGDYTTAMGKALGDLILTVSMEAMRNGLYLIQEAWPAAVKFLALPLQRADIEPDAMLPWLGEMAQLARRMGFIVIDAFGESGIVADFEAEGVAGRDLYDGLHPDPSGQYKQAMLMAAVIRSRVPALQG